jgi:hypothetical protein
LAHEQYKNRICDFLLAFLILVRSHHRCRVAANCCFHSSRLSAQGQSLVRNEFDRSTLEKAVYCTSIFRKRRCRHSPLDNADSCPSDPKPLCCTTDCFIRRSFNRRQSLAGYMGFPLDVIDPTGYIRGQGRDGEATAVMVKRCEGASKWRIQASGFCSPSFTVGDSSTRVVLYLLKD